MHHAFFSQRLPFEVVWPRMRRVIQAKAAVFTAWSAYITWTYCTLPYFSVLNCTVLYCCIVDLFQRKLIPDRWWVCGQMMLTRLWIYTHNLVDSWWHHDTEAQDGTENFQSQFSFSWFTLLPFLRSNLCMITTFSVPSIPRMEELISHFKYKLYICFATIKKLLKAEVTVASHRLTQHPLTWLIFSYFFHLSIAAIFCLFFVAAYFAADYYTLTPVSQTYSDNQNLAPKVEKCFC